MNDAYAIIRDAILNKQQIVARYRGYAREMCPHVLGTKDGREQALFYQFAGSSRSGLGADGSPNNWRCMFIDELSEVEAQDGEWHSAPKHTQRQTCVDQIDVEVEI